MRIRHFLLSSLLVLLSAVSCTEKKAVEYPMFWT